MTTKSTEAAALDGQGQIKFNSESASSSLSYVSARLMKKAQRWAARIGGYSSAEVAKRGGLLLQKTAHTSAEGGVRESIPKLQKLESQVKKLERTTQKIPTKNYANVGRANRK